MVIPYGAAEEGSEVKALHHLGLYAFTAAVLGGIGNINGAALGGFVIGLLSALTVTYAGGQWENVGVFSILVIILVFRPTGLLGQETGEKA